MQRIAHSLKFFWRWVARTLPSYFLPDNLMEKFALRCHSKRVIVAFVLVRYIINVVCTMSLKIKLNERWKLNKMLQDFDNLIIAKCTPKALFHILHQSIQLYYYHFIFQRRCDHFTLLQIRKHWCNNITIPHCYLTQP